MGDLRELLDYIDKVTAIKAIPKLLISAASDTGKVRQRNEDHFYADGIGIMPEECGQWRAQWRNKTFLAAVCDGMGGESYGKEASHIAVSVLEKRWKDDSDKGPALAEWVNSYVQEANHEILEMTFREHCRTSGSTLALVCIEDGKAHVFHIGDSRVYVCRGGKLEQITEDQTLAMKKLKANIYTAEEARSSPDSHKITSFLGVDTREIGLKAIVQEPFSLDDGILLLCSDGLTDMCTDEEIAEILVDHKDSPASALVERALEHGGEDNVTCVVIQYA